MMRCIPAARAGHVVFAWNMRRTTAIFVRFEHGNGMEDVGKWMFFLSPMLFVRGGNRLGRAQKTRTPASVVLFVSSLARISLRFGITYVLLRLPPEMEGGRKMGAAFGMSACFTVVNPPQRVSLGLSASRCPGATYTCTYIVR